MFGRSLSQKQMDKINTSPVELKGTKGTMSPRFTADGKRIVVTKINLAPDTKPAEFLTAGDPVKVTGWTKGRGFMGVMKRWGFKGGPRTHGQSDRARAPGSIGQTTTPGRIYKGKKMAGRMGGNRQTISGLSVFEVSQEDHFLSVTGPIPGPKNSPIVVRVFTTAMTQSKDKPAAELPAEEGKTNGKN